MAIFTFEIRYVKFKHKTTLFFFEYEKELSFL